MKNYGFIPEETKPDHWSMGSGLATKKFGATSLMPDGHGWGKFIPKKEIQKRGSLETSACTVFGSANCYETLANFYKYNEFPKDLAERYNAILANITPEGGSIHDACETFRQFGGFPESKLPFSEDIRDWTHFYHPKPMPEEYVKLGQELLRKFNLGHEWVYNGGAPKDYKEKLKQALARGTVGISVSAWKEKNGKYVSEKENNHWVQLVDYVEGKYWVVNDHYEPTEKRLDWNHNIYCAKLFFLSPNYDGIIPSERNTLVSLIKRLISLLQKQLGSWINSSPK